MEKQPVLNMNLNRGQESLGLIPRFKLAINYCFCIQRRLSSVHLEGREKTRAKFSFSKVFFLFFVLMRSVLFLASLPASRYIFLAKPAASCGSEDSNLLSGLTFYKGNYLSPQGSLSINKNKQPHYEKDSKTH